MLDDLDRTLEVLLQKRLPKKFAELPISFAPPGDHFPPSGVTLPALGLFLYDVRANSDLKSNDWAIDRRPAGVTRRPPPVRVDCSYLITAWVPEAADAAVTEHGILGEVLRVLVRYPTIPDVFLQGALADASQDQYLSLLINRSAETGESLRTQETPWSGATSLTARG